MNDNDIREAVSRTYTEALRNATTADLARVAGYDDHHADAVVTSFGCGNPLAFAGVLPGQTVVDLGSGAGLDLLIAAEKVGPTGKVIGIDMTDAMLDAARAAAAKAGLSHIIDVRKGIIEELPVAAGSVDWVISNCVINLSPDKPAVFREIARVLKPGGHISVSDIVAEDLPDWIRHHAGAYAACVGGAISEGEYLQGLRSVGVVDAAVSERLVYDDDQIKAVVASGVGDLGLDEAVLNMALAQVSGKVWSAKFVGSKAP